jgi:hypothetical protein
MGGGGDDFSAQAAQSDLKKQRARDALNLQFGMAPTGPAPTAADFTTPETRTTSGGYQDTDGAQYGAADVVTPGRFDEAGYQVALESFQGAGAEAEKNKAAREALYGTVRDNAFTAGNRVLDERKGDASRDLKFALFGQGLNGGSEDINQNALLDRTYKQGKLDLGARADAAATDLRGSDESTRLQLLQSIDAGMDQSSALSSSLNSLKVNSDRATAEAQGTSLGDLFGDAGLLYTKSKAGQGVMDARSAFQTQYPQYGGGRGGRGGSSTGIISSTGP